jgi:hypothetical protein
MIETVLYYTCTYSETLPNKSTPFLVHEDNQEYRNTLSDDRTGIPTAHWVSIPF